MREKIIEVLNEENRKMNPKEIMDRINPDNTIDELRDLMDELDSMCRDGILKSGANTYFFNDLTIGKLDVHGKGSAHLIVKGGEDIYIHRDHLKGANDGDLVSVEITNQKTNEGRVVNILKRSLGNGVGIVVDDNGHLYVEPLSKDLPYEIIVDESKVNLADGMYVHLDYVRDIDKHRVLACADKVLGHINGFKDEKGETSDTARRMIEIGAEFGRMSSFPDEVLEESKQFKTTLDPKEVEEEIKKGVVDLRGETITTTDGKDTKDIDDAINSTVLPNGNYREITSIADVSRYVKMGSAIWKYAEEKGNSDYWGNKVAPMLPIELSNGICSLFPNEDKFAITVEYELTQSGEIVNPNVYLSVIKSKKQMNYDAVQDIIDGKETEDTKDYTVLKYTVKENETIDDIAFKYAMTKEELLEYNKESDFKPGLEINIPVRKEIELQYVTSKIQGAALNRRGKTNFNSVEPKYVFGENDKVIDVKRRIQREAETIIENKMIYANEAFTMFMVNELSKITTDMIPFVFRTHGSPNPEKIKEFLDMLDAYGVDLGMHIDPENITSKQIDQILEKLKDKSTFSVFSDKLLRCMQKAQYTHENYGHFGVASDNYTHFTSPIRRMCDLLVHTIFRVFCVEKKRDPKTLKFWGEYLDRICEKISECEVNAQKCEYEQWNMLNALYMQDKLGILYDASIEELLPSAFFVRADNLVEGRVDYYLTENDSREVMKMTDQNEILAFVEQHKKVFSSDFEYNEKLYGYTRNNRTCYRLGDRVVVCCTAADPDAREIDFALVRKL